MIRKILVTILTILAVAAGWDSFEPRWHRAELPHHVEFGADGGWLTLTHWDGVDFHRTEKLWNFEMGLFSIQHYTTGFGCLDVYTTLHVPRGSFCVLLALYPVIAFVRGPFRRWRAGRRFPAGHCLHCGYNLTGLPEPRCPECGTAFEVEG